jgi:hypothetical protein
LHGRAGTAKRPQSEFEQCRSRRLEYVMRAETQNLVDEIKQSLTLLRRHL